MAIVHANAQTFPQEVLQSNETVLVDFWAAWCGPCKMLAPILEELDGVAPCKIVKVDVDENRALALQYAVASIPTLLVFRNVSNIHMCMHCQIQLLLQRLMSP